MLKQPSCSPQILPLFPPTLPQFPSLLWTHVTRGFKKKLRCQWGARRHVSSLSSPSSSGRRLLFSRGFTFNFASNLRLHFLYLVQEIDNIASRTHPSSSKSAEINSSLASYPPTTCRYFELTSAVAPSYFSLKWLDLLARVSLCWHYFTHEKVNTRIDTNLRIRGYMPIL